MFLRDVACQKLLKSDNVSVQGVIHKITLAQFFETWCICDLHFIRQSKILKQEPKGCKIGRDRFFVDSPISFAAEAEFIP